MYIVMLVLGRKRFFYTLQGETSYESYFKRSSNLKRCYIEWRLYIEETFCSSCGSMVLGQLGQDDKNPKRKLIKQALIFETIFNDKKETSKLLNC